MSPGVATPCPAAPPIPIAKDCLIDFLQAAEPPDIAPRPPDQIPLDKKQDDFDDAILNANLYTPTF
jgi:hypothetical protein